MINHVFESDFLRFFLARTSIDPARLNASLLQCGIGSEELIQKAAKDSGHQPLDEDIFLVLAQTPQLKAFLKHNGLETNDVSELISWYSYRQLKASHKKFWSKEFLLSIPSIGEQWTAGFTPTLDSLSQDLSRQNLMDYSFYGRQNELKQLIQELSREHQPNVLLSGDPGTGRHSLVFGLAQSIQLHHAGYLNNRRVLILRTDKFLSHTQERNAADVLYDLLNEAESAGNIILVIPEFHELLVGSKLVHDLTPAFEEKLSRGRFQLIGITTPQDYFNLIKPEESVMKYLTMVEIKAVSASDTLHILFNQIEDIEKTRRMFFPYQTLKAVVTLADRYISGDPFPEKALDLIDELISIAQTNNQNTLSPRDVESLITQKTHIPVGTLDQDEKALLLDLEAQLKTKIIAQDPAVTVIAKALRRARSGVRVGNKPIGSFFFLGPTGVGKTETAKVLSQIYFKHQNLIRFDMAEYQTADAVERLIGSFSQEKPGLLSTAIQSQPYGILLLDEFEKAPVAVHNIFLSLLDEGKFTSADGKTIDCKNLIVIATSNAGTETLREYLRLNPTGDHVEEFMSEYLLKEHIFPPELLNRFDAVVFYRPLDGEGLRQVTKLLLEKLASALRNDKNLTVTFKPELIDEIVAKGYNPDYGARSVDRYIQDTIQDTIAKKLLENPNLESLNL